MLIYIKKILTFAGICIFEVFVMTDILLSLDSSVVISQINNYEGVFCDEAREAGINYIDNYITEKESAGYRVRIADTSACLYKIPLDTYEKNWDMLLVGNLGTNSVEELLETEDDTLYLVYRDESIFDMQDHIELIHYIKDNYRCVDRLKGYDVYEKLSENKK